MSGSVNKAIIIGHLGRDPEIRTTQSGAKIANLNIATSESWNDKRSGERQERTEWHRVTIYNEHLVGVAERFLRKGRQVYIEGKLQTRKWQDKSGQDRFTTEIVLDAFRGEIVLLDNKPEATPARSQSSHQSHDRHTPYGNRSMSDAAPVTSSQSLDDDIPF